MTKSVGAQSEEGKVAKKVWGKLLIVEWRDVTMCEWRLSYYGKLQLDSGISYR